MTRRLALRLAIAGAIIGAGGSLLWTLALAEWADWIAFAVWAETRAACGL